MAERDENIGFYEHARRLFEEHRAWDEHEHGELRDYIDKRNTHRRQAQETINRTVATHEAELMRGEDKPGWVHTRIKAMELAQAAAAETLKWQNRLLFGTLLGLLANLAAPLLRKG